MILKLFGKYQQKLKRKNRKLLIYKGLRFCFVLKAGLEPARALLPTGF